MKKVVYILLAVAIVFSFASCKNEIEQYEQLNPLSVMDTQKLSSVLKAIYSGYGEGEKVVLTVKSGEYTIKNFPVSNESVEGVISTGTIYWTNDKLHIDFNFAGTGTTPSFNNVKVTLDNNDFALENRDVMPYVDTFTYTIGSCSQVLTEAQKASYLKLILSVIDNEEDSLRYAIDHCNPYVYGTRTVEYSITNDLNYQGLVIDSESTLTATYNTELSKKMIIEYYANVTFDLKSTVNGKTYNVSYNPTRNEVSFSDGSRYLGTTAFEEILCVNAVK